MEIPGILYWCMGKILEDPESTMHGNKIGTVLCLGKILDNTQSNDAWEQRVGWLN